MRFKGFDLQTRGPECRCHGKLDMVTHAGIPSAPAAGREAGTGDALQARGPASLT